MSFRVFIHIGFWVFFVMLYAITKVLFASEELMELPPLQRFTRYLLAELAFFPWKIIPFYFLFSYLIPKYFRKGEYFKFGVYSLLTIIVSLFGHRSMIFPVFDYIFKVPVEFNVYSIKRLLYTLLDILPAIGLASTIKLLRSSVASQQKQQELEKEKLKSELNFLKAQTNPHFLFNTLNNLYGLARKNDNNTAPSIMKLSKIMRYIIYECSAPTVPIQNEVLVIEDYIELEKLRYDERLHVNFEKKVDNWKQDIASLILLPFVENAFKHGASESRADTFIDISLVLQQEHLSFKIKNTREYTTEQVEPPREGIGLKNVKRQLDLVYGSDYALKILPEPDMYSVELSMHLQHDN